MRKDHVKPVSRMRKHDISAEIQKLKGHREETPIPAVTPASDSAKPKSAVMNIKKAKDAEFPTVPGDKQVKGKSGKVSAPPKEVKQVKEKMSKKDMLLAILEGLGDDS